MKKFLILLISIFLFLPMVVNAEEKVIDIHLFFSSTCPHCKEEKKFLNDLAKKDSSIEIHLYQINGEENKENSELLDKVQKLIDGETPYIPYTVIGSKYRVGFNSSTKVEIESIIKSYKEEGYVDIVGGIINGEITEENISEYLKKAEVEIEMPDDKSIEIFGKEISLKGLSLPIISILIGLVDGFNPCAMWILLFLIGMLLGMKDRKKMWYLGSLFIVTSAGVYLLFMLAWLNIIKDLAMVRPIQIIIAIVALIGAVVNVRSYIKEVNQGSGCQVVDDKKRKKIFSKIRKFTSEKSLLLASVGIITLAISVNIVELACSAGLPVLFTNILAINKVSAVMSNFYMLLYILFFMLDDLIVFIVAMITLKVTGMTTKYTKYTHLIGGLIMLLIGVLLIFKPEWIMFNF